MKKEFKFLAFLMVIVIMLVVATGCSSIPGLNNFVDQAKEAQKQAEQIESQVKDFVDKLEGEEDKFEDYFDISNIPENAKVWKQ